MVTENLFKGNPDACMGMELVFTSAQSYWITGDTRET